MRALYQGLAALDPHTFELLVFQLVKARYPHADVKHVDGSAGDQGLDVISGQLDAHPTIWQCKSFTNGIKDSQRRQIKGSLDQALRNFNPRRWILCLSTDMDGPALRWFQRLAASRASSTQIVLWQASDLVRELLYQHTIREAFLPNTVIGTKELREALAKTGELTPNELANISAENADLYLQRLQAYDARFAYALTYTRDHKPEERAPAGALLTVVTDNHVLAVYGRDKEALRHAPPRASFTLHGTGIEKLLLNIRTGAPQTLQSGEISNFTSDFDFIIPVSEHDDLVVHLKPTSSPKHRFLRVIFGAGGDAVTYEDVPFKRIRPGKYQSAGVLPIQIVITIKNDGTGTLSFHDHTEGHRPEEVQKFLGGLAVALSTGEIAFYDESSRRPFLTHTLSGDIPGLLSYRALIDDAVQIATSYRVPLRMPAAVSVADKLAISRLKQLLTGVTIDADEVCFELTKTIELTPACADAFSGGNLQIMVNTPGLPEGFQVFGTTVPTGPIDIEITVARVQDSDAFIEFILNAPLGATTNLTVDARAPVIARRAERDLIG